MTPEDRKKRALEFLNSSRKYHVDVSYGADCQVYKDYGYVVDINVAKHAIEIALGNC